MTGLALIFGAPITLSLFYAHRDDRRRASRDERSARAGSSWSVPSRRGRHR